jgi:hypothetical protein
VYTQLALVGAEKLEERVCDAAMREISGIIREAHFTALHTRLQSASIFVIYPPQPTLRIYRPVERHHQQHQE